MVPKLLYGNIKLFALSHGSHCSPRSQQATKNAPAKVCRATVPFIPCSNGLFAVRHPQTASLVDVCYPSSKTNMSTRMQHVTPFTHVTVTTVGASPSHIFHCYEPLLSTSLHICGLFLRFFASHFLNLFYVHTSKQHTPVLYSIIFPPSANVQHCPKRAQDCSFTVDTHSRSHSRYFKKPLPRTQHFSTVFRLWLRFLYDVNTVPYSSRTRGYALHSERISIQPPDYRYRTTPLFRFIGSLFLIPLPCRVRLLRLPNALYRYKKTTFYNGGAPF